MTTIKNGTRVLVVESGGVAAGVVCDLYTATPDGVPLTSVWYSVIVASTGRFIYVPEDCLFCQ